MSCMKCSKAVPAGTYICPECLMSLFGLNERTDTQKNDEHDMKVEITHVIWLSLGQNEHQRIGVIKRYDEQMSKYRYYIGIGNGFHDQHDIQSIIKTGRAFESLEFLKDF